MPILARSPSGIRRRLPVAILGALVVVGAFVPALGSRSASEASSASVFAVYLQPASVPAGDRLSLSDDEAGEILDGREFRIVETVQEFGLLVAAQRPQSLWVHADVIADVPTSLLRDAMHQGAVIVGIDMPSGTLTSKLKVSGSATSDWHPEGVVTFVLYGEALYVPSTNEQGQASTRSFRTRANERFDPAHPARLLHLVDETVDRIREMHG